MDKIVDSYTLNQSVDYSSNSINSILEVLDIESISSKIEELEKASSDASFWLNQEVAKKTIDELNDLKRKLSSFNSIKEKSETLLLIKELGETDNYDEANNVLNSFIKEYEELENLLLLSEKEDKLNAIVEIHSGAGGTESLDWVQMLYRMYTMYAQKNKFKLTVLDYEDGDVAGIKSVTFKVEGLYAYGYLKSEQGVHRLVRLSPFDSSNRRHTTFASVSVSPEINDEIIVEIDEKDLRIDVFHSSGAGGQGVNTTDSAVRVTHIPTKIVVTCQNERSQIQNKETAIKILKSKLYSLELEKRKEELDRLNDKMQISFGSQIRSYVFHPYTLVKDHRTDYETSQGDKVMDGDLDGFISSYLKWRGKPNA